MTRAQFTESVRQAMQLQREGRFIESIKLLRAVSGSGLQQAHDAAQLLRKRTKSRAA
jgi:ribosomal protein L7/L12